jgi:hypothetical protein
VGDGVTVGVGVGDGVTEGGGLNFGPGHPARRIQVRKSGPASLPIREYFSTPLPHVCLRGRRERAGVTRSNGVIFPGVR